MGWEKGQWQGAPLWINGEWWAKDLGHGFLGRIETAHSSASSLEIVARHLQVPIVALHQVHGTHIVRGRSLESPHQGLSRVQADGMVFDLSELGPQGQCYALLTADCAPVFIKGEHRVALVHAGWRGVAAGIVERALEAVGSSRAEVVVGPAAGPNSYEVGAEVIESIGDRAVWKPSEGGSCLLGIPQTIKGIAEGFGAQVHILEDDTMTDRNFYSHRRGEKGRNVTLLGTGHSCRALLQAFGKGLPTA